MSSAKKTNLRGLEKISREDLFEIVAKALLLRLEERGVALTWQEMEAAANTDFELKPKVGGDGVVFRLRSDG